MAYMKQMLLYLRQYDIYVKVIQSQIQVNVFDAVEGAITH